MRRRSLLLPLLIVALATTARAADAPQNGGGAAAPARKPLDPKDKAKLTEIFAGYLDLGGGYFSFRIKLLEELKALKATGVDVLADVPSLKSIVYAARPFEPFFDKKLLARGDKTSEISFDSASGIVNVAADQLSASSGPVRLSLSIPAGYADLAKNPKKLNAMAPYPVIITLHEMEDFQDAKGAKKHPGMECLRRRYDRANKELKPLVDGSFVLAPVVTKARFVEEGRLQGKKVMAPFREVFSRCHVDFDRVFADGGSDALLLAASNPAFFAGVIVRGDAADLAPDLVRNLAGMPVYVVGGDGAAAAKTLKEQGHGAVTVGPVSGLPAFVEKTQRSVPRKFGWTLKDTDAQILAHWVNIDRVDASTASPGMEVECLDTKEDPNTIRVTARGIRTVSFFLSDAVVDLDREVRIVVNGDVVKEARRRGPKGTPLVAALPAKFERSLDTMFDNEDNSVRRLMYYGVWQPVVLQSVNVPGDAAAAAAPKPPPEGGEAEAERIEREAQIYFEKAEAKEAAGDSAKALELYRRAADVGESTFKAKAEAKIRELEAKAGGK